MKKVIAVSALGAIALAGGIAVAQTGEVRAPGAPTTRADATARADARFDRLDADKDGKLTGQDRAARAKERADRMFAALDTDKNGQISRTEFDAGRAKAHEGFAERRQAKAEAGKMGEHRGHQMRGHRWGGRMGTMGGSGGGEGWFAKADANKDGKLTLAEMQAGPLQWFDSVDANKDGTISPEERKAAFDKMRQARAERRAQTPAQPQQN